MEGRTVRGRAKAATAAVLVAMLLPVPSITGGSDHLDGPGDTLPTLLMVDIQNMTSVEWTSQGLVTASNGGGIVRWNGTGVIADLWTVGDGLPSNHVRDIDTKGSRIVAATRDGIAIYRESEGWWTPDIGPKEDMVSVIYDGTDFCWALSANGTGYGSSYDLNEWTPINLPSPLPLEDWEGLVMDESYTVLTNGTGIVIVHNSLFEATTPVMPAAGEVRDIAIQDGLVFVAMEEHPDIYDIDGGRWLGPALTASAALYALDWVAVDADADAMWVCSANGTVISLPLDDPFGDTDWVHAGDVGSGSPTLEIRDIDVQAELVATNEGAWGLISNGIIHYSSLEKRQLSSMLTDKGIEGLTLDSSGEPSEWIEGHLLEGVSENAIIDAVELAGVVYIAGTGQGIWTWDTFASSKTSRWDQVHYYDDVWRDPVVAVEVLDGVLYAAGTFGLDQMVIEDEVVSFTAVEGGPSRILSMTIQWGDILVGSENGIWSYDPRKGWQSPDDLKDMLPMSDQRVSSMVIHGNYYYMAIGGSIHWGWRGISTTMTVLSTTSDITSLATPGDLGGPVWATLDGEALAINHPEEGEIVAPERDAMGDALIRDANIGPDGTVYLSSDSGVLRLDAFRSTWSQWTTSSGLSANDLRDLSLEPGSDNLWTCAYGGVDILDTGAGGLTRIGVEGGLPSNLVYDVMITHGEVWVGTDVGGAGRRALDGETWQVYNSSTGLVADDVQALARSGDHVLFGTDEGVTVLDLVESTYSTHTASSTGGELPDNWVWCALDGNDKIIVGTPKGLGIYMPSSDTWDPFGGEDLAGLDIRSLAWDSVGRAWIGTSTGLAIHSLSGSEDRDMIGLEEGLPGEEVLSLMLGSDGMMWVGTSGGLALLDMDGRVHGTFTTQDGLVHDRVTAIEEHPDGTIWLATAGGLSRLEKERFDLLPQYVGQLVDLPDIYVTLADVRILPEEPTEGEEVDLLATIHNPSGKRAIATVALYNDQAGSPGEQITTAIAYTEPGESYTVELPWVAQGGEQLLWILVDPGGKVPESNERNNAVAVSIHVNRPPTLGDGTYTLDLETLDASGRMINVTVEVIYSDPDGDPPHTIDVLIPGDDPNVPMVPVAGTGSVKEGLSYRAELNLAWSNWSLRVNASDGVSGTTMQLELFLGLEIQVHGVTEGEELHGRVLFTVDVLESVEGIGVPSVDLLVPPDDWNEDVPPLPHQCVPVDVRIEGDLRYSFDSEDLPQRSDIIYFVATDRFGFSDTVSFLEVSREDTVVNGVPAVYLIAVLLIIPIAIIILAVLRSSKGGDSN
jgi:ligand-binding sensor domain-containing protein